jgi:hypothetical protein
MGWGGLDHYFLLRCAGHALRAVVRIKLTRSVTQHRSSKWGRVAQYTGAWLVLRIIRIIIIITYNKINTGCNISFIRGGGGG